MLRSRRPGRLVPLRVQRLLRDDRPGNRHPENFLERGAVVLDAVQRSGVVLQVERRGRVPDGHQEHRSRGLAPGGHQQ